MALCILALKGLSSRATFIRRPAVSITRSFSSSIVIFNRMSLSKYHQFVPGSSDEESNSDHASEVRTNFSRYNHFVAGSSHDESDGNDSSSAAVDSVIEVGHVSGFTVDEKQVDDVVTSCMRGLVKIRSVSVSPQPIASISDRKRTLDNSAAAPLLNAKREKPDTTTENASMAKTTDPAMLEEKKKKETELERLMRLRAERFSIPPDQQKTVNGSKSPASNPRASPTALIPVVEIVPKGERVVEKEEPDSKHVKMPSNVSSTGAITRETDGSKRCRRCFLANREAVIVFSHEESECTFPTNVAAMNPDVFSGCAVCFDANKPMAVVFSHHQIECPFANLETSVKGSSRPLLESSTGSGGLESVSSVVQIAAPAQQVPEVRSTPLAKIPKEITIPVDTSRAPALPSKIVSELVALLRKGDYNDRLTPLMLADAMRILGPGRAKYVSQETLQSIRHSALLERAIHVHSKLNQRDISDRYERGESLASLAQSLGAPAFNVFRCVLRARGMDPQMIKDVVAGRAILPHARDARERDSAVLIDTVSTELDSRVENAQQLETTIGQMLLATGATFKTQDDLKGSSLTPDFLLDESITLKCDKHPIKWIDAKDMFGGPSSMQVKRLKKQAHKYADAFGPGALMFSMGFSEGLREGMDPKVALMDLRWLQVDKVIRVDGAPAFSSSSSGLAPLLSDLPSMYVPVSSSSSAAQSKAASPIPSLLTTTQPESTATGGSLSSSAISVPQLTLAATEAGGSKKRVASLSDALPKRPKIHSIKEAWEHVIHLLETEARFVEPMDPRLVDEINSTLSQVGANENIYTKEEVEQMRHVHLYDKRRYLEGQNESDAVKLSVVERWKKGSTAMDIAKEYNVPPLLVMRWILEAHDAAKDARIITKPTVSMALLQQSFKEKKISSRELDQLVALRHLGLTFELDEKPFEERVIGFLKSVRVEAESAPAKGIASHVRVNTPLTIEGKTIKWIITSNQVGGLSQKNMMDVASRTGSLMKALGTGGAVVFSLGFVQELIKKDTFKDITLVDFRLLSVEK